ncbi:Hypothetical protein NCS54_00217700 [Fusarium falciforme]|uniref:Hypothetical protein n=1 Tax=Fusarium falciforme TaxID=195108 RepID=UPI002300D8DF|nr:Hypothetical protein NCS54_00217700 [Fusarium falciforme]WAO84945.1 Hypothetical protein NCS54_00217700 [Fusarium falciforme]
MGPNPPGHPLIGDLFNAILGSCVNSYQRLTSDEQSRRLRSESERFFLWGDGVSAANGQLDKALPTSSELYQTVLSALYQLGKVIDVDLVQVIATSQPTNAATDTRELRLLLEEARAILGTPNATEVSESLSDDENGPCSLEDILDDMVTYIDCLMDLSPPLENIIIYPESIRSESTSIEPAIVELNERKPPRTRPTPSGSSISSYRTYVGLEIPRLSAPTMPVDGNPLYFEIDDSGLPHFQVTITLFEGAPRERVVHLGPWEVQESNERRVIWQGANQNEILEHYFPSNDPSDVHPHTLHARHRPYNEPVDMEQYLTFQEPHRIRHINGEGVCIHDEFINVKYEFSSAESSMQFQEDVRRKDLVDFYDTDVVWTNIHGRTDSFGNVRGVATVQRLKLWRDRATSLYSLSIHQNKANRQYRDYNLGDFHVEISHRDDKANRLRLRALHQDGDNGRRPITANWLQPRRSSEASESRLRRQSTDSSIRYLAIQFSERAAYRRFIETWETCQSPDSLSNQLQLPLRGVMATFLTQEQPQRGTMNLSPGPSNLTEAKESSGRQE